MQPEILQNSVLVNGTSFNYYRAGHQKSPSKLVLVLQHGFSDNGLCWAPVAQELAGDYDILMPDARGHGQSARVQPGDRVDQAADLAVVMGALGIDQAVVAGHSMGAQIASQMGARYPELVRAMILEDPPWFLPPPEPQTPRQGSMEDSPMGQWMRGLKDQSLEQIIEQCRTEHPNWLEAYVKAWCQGKKELDLNFLKLEHRWGASWQEDVKAYACPVLLVTADPAQGGIVSPEVEKIVSGLNPKIQIANFPGIGHHVRFAVHAAYMQTVRAFLQEVG